MHFLRRAIAGTRTSPQAQQQAVSPSQWHRIIKGTSASELKASQAHIWAKEYCGNGYMACMAKRGLKDVTSFN